MRGSSGVPSPEVTTGPYLLILIRQPRLPLPLAHPRYELCPAVAQGEVGIQVWGCRLG